MAAHDDAGDVHTPAHRTAGGVQSVSRALELLDLMAGAGTDMSLSELAEGTGMAAATTHRLMRTLLAHGYVRQLPSRRYGLGPALIRLGEQAGLHLGAAARPHLDDLAAQAGETVNLAMLDQDMVVYVAQAASRHSMRMFTEVGRRVHAHSTGVGKAVLAELPDAAVLRILERAGMPPATEHTITGPEEFLTELGTIRSRGYAIDDGEQEVGVRCVAMAVPEAPTPTAVSVSGPAARLDLAGLEALLPALRRTAGVLAGLYATEGP
ncbi:IclR family transcriptional regulator [Pseudactinotalea sp. Z1739]|uniref:IclR family transcriptional regulator n=1 Tax=Pseudactinotalea sp. Z1739 TaxID=3413028 RepID=UPI003C79F1ED